MGFRSTPDFTALNYGYISPKLRGRADLDFYDQAVDFLQNYVVTPQGEISLRPGSMFVAQTRGDKVARLIPFLFETSTAYVLELTDQMMRFYTNNGQLTENIQGITGVTQADPAVVTYDDTDGDNYANGDPIVLAGVGGAHQLNGREFKVANVDTTANTFELQDFDGNNIDSTAYGAYTSGGTVAKIVEVVSPYTEAELFEVDFTQTNDQMYMVHKDHEPRKLTLSGSTFSLGIFSRTADPFASGTPNNWPSVVTLFEGRIYYAASDQFPTRIWASKILTTGSLDDMTVGTDDSDGFVYNVRADQANRIRWVAGAESYIAFGTSGSEFRISGGGDNNAITPTNISIKPTSFNGVAQVRPIRLDSYILYLQRNGKTVRSFEYNALQDGYVSPDRTLLADHIAKSKIKQFSYTAGTPNIIWSVRNDGVLLGLTFDPSQQVVAWHPHKTDGRYESIATIPEADEDDELWQVVTRTINGTTRRYVEYIPNVPDVPVFEDYFTGKNNKESDTETYLTDLWNVQKTMLHSDCSLKYDGRDSASVALTITGNLTTDEVITVTADGAFFTAAMATEKRRIQTPDGGQFEITGFTSSTVVTARVLYDLEGTTFAANTWYYMAKGISGLFHIEGATVSVLVDGGSEEDKVVTNGEITLDDDGGYVIVGLPYIGIGKTQDVTGASEIGRGQTKSKNMTRLMVRFRASLGTEFGTSLYNTEAPDYRVVEEVSGRPPRLYDGVLKVPLPDSWDAEKYIYWLHLKPTPSNIQYMQPLMETNDD